MKVTFLIVGILGLLVLLGIMVSLMRLIELVERGNTPQTPTPDDLVANSIALHMRMQRGSLAKTDEAMAGYQAAVRGDVSQFGPPLTKPRPGQDA